MEEALQATIFTLVLASPLYVLEHLAIHTLKPIPHTEGERK